MRLAPFFLGCGLLLSLPAFAQENVEKAKKEMAAGSKDFNDGNCKSALGHFKAASELVPTAAGPHREIAKAHECLEKYEEAKAEYETYLQMKPDATDAAEIQGFIEEVKKKIKETTPDPTENANTPEAPGTISFTVEKGAKIYLDDQLVGKAPLKAPHSATPGKHTVRVEKKGFEPLTKEIEVSSGGSLEFNEALVPASGDGTEPADRGEVKKAPVIAGFTVGAAGIGVGIFAGFKALELSDELKARENEPIPLDEFEDILKDGQNLNRATIAGYAVGGLGVGTAVFFLVRRGEPKEEETAQNDTPRVTVLPSVNGASVKLRF